MNSLPLRLIFSFVFLLVPSIASAASLRYAATLQTNSPTERGEADCSYDTTSHVLSCKVTFEGIRPYQGQVVYTRPITGDHTIIDFRSPSTSPLEDLAELDLVQQIALTEGRVSIRLDHPGGTARGKLEPVSAPDAGTSDAALPVDASYDSGGPAASSGAPPSTRPEGGCSSGTRGPSEPENRWSTPLLGLAFVFYAITRRRTRRT